MVKKKLLSLSLVAVMTISSIAPAFAEEIEENIFVDNGAEIVIETGDSQIIPMGNERYRYVTKTSLSNKKTKSFTVSEKQARTERLYESFIKSSISLLIPAGKAGKALGFALSMFSVEFYTSPYAASGKYVVTTYTIKESKVNVITKKGYISRTGYKIIVSHNGKKVSRIFWFK